MKIWMSIVVALTLIGSVLGSPSRYRVQSESFKYEGQIMTSVFNPMQSHSGTDLKMDITMTRGSQEETYFSFQNVKSTKFNQKFFYPEEIPRLAGEQQKDVKQLEGNFTVYLGKDSGVVMRVPKGEEIWVTNIRKAIVTLFRVPAYVNDYKLSHQMSSGESDPMLRIGYKQREATYAGRCNIGYTTVMDYNNGTYPGSSPPGSINYNGAVPEIYIRVRRSIDFDSCQSASRYTKASFGNFSTIQNNTFQRVQQRSLVGEYAFVKVTNPREPSLPMYYIRGANIEGAQIIKPFGQDTGRLAILTNQTLNSVQQQFPRQPLSSSLQDVSTWIYQFTSPAAPKTGGQHQAEWVKYQSKSDLLAPIYPEYAILGRHPKPQEELLSFAKQTLEEVTHLQEQPIDYNQHGYNGTTDGRLVERLRQLSSVIRTLEKDHIESLWKSVSNGGASPALKIKKQVFLDAASASGSSAALEVLVEAFKKGEVDEYRQASLLSTLSSNIRDPASVKKVMEYVMQVDPEHQLYLGSFSYINVAKMLQKVCVNSHLKNYTVPDALLGQKICERSTVDPFINHLKSKFESATKDYMKMLYVQSLARLGDSRTINFIKEIFTPGYKQEQEVSTKVKLAAIYALSKNFPDQKDKYQIIDAMLAIVQAPSELKELRQVALMALIEQRPNATVYQRLAMGSWYEPDAEVRSMITSVFTTLAQSRDRYNSVTVSIARKMLPLMKPVFPSYKHNGYFPRRDPIIGYNTEVDRSFFWFQSYRSPTVPRQMFQRTKGLFGGMPVPLYEMFSVIQGSHLSSASEILKTLSSAFWGNQQQQHQRFRQQEDSMYHAQQEGSYAGQQHRSSLEGRHQQQGSHSRQQHMNSLEGRQQQQQQGSHSRQQHMNSLEGRQQQQQQESDYKKHLSHDRQWQQQEDRTHKQQQSRHGVQSQWQQDEPQQQYSSQHHRRQVEGQWQQDQFQGNTRDPQFRRMHQQMSDITDSMTIGMVQTGSSSEPQLYFTLGAFDVEAFLPVDQDTLPKIFQAVRSAFKKSSNSRSGHLVPVDMEHATKYVNPVDIVVALPTSFGLPSIIRVQTPTNLYWGNKFSVKADSTYPENVNITVDGMTKMTYKAQAYATVLVPWNNQVSVAAYDTEATVSFPGKVSVVMNATFPYMITKINVSPNFRGERPVMYYRTKPFTAVQPSLSPAADITVIKDLVTPLANNSHSYNESYWMNDKLVQQKIHLDYQGDAQFPLNQGNIWKILENPSRLYTLVTTPTQHDVTCAVKLNIDASKAKNISMGFVVDYARIWNGDTASMFKKSKTELAGVKISQAIASLAKSKSPLSLKKLVGIAEQNQGEIALAIGFNFTQMNVRNQQVFLVLSVDDRTPTDTIYERQYTFNSIATVADQYLHQTCANLNVREKKNPTDKTSAPLGSAFARVIVKVFNGICLDDKSSAAITSESDFFIETQRPRNQNPNQQHSLRSDPAYIAPLLIPRDRRFDPSEVTGWKNDAYISYAHGKISYNPNMPAYLQNVTYIMRDWIAAYAFPHLVVDRMPPVQPAPKGTVEYSMMRNNYSGTIDASVRTPELNAIVEQLPISAMIDWITPFIGEHYELGSDKRQSSHMTTEGGRASSSQISRQHHRQSVNRSPNDQVKRCTIRPTQVETFDRNTYTKSAGACEQTVLRVTGSEPITITTVQPAQPTSSSPAKAKISVSDVVVEMEVSGSQAAYKVKVNGQEIAAPRLPYVLKNTQGQEIGQIALKYEKLHIVIYRQLKVVGDKNGLLTVNMSSRYSGMAKGMCGTANRDTNRDLISVDNCLMSPSQGKEFAASYMVNQASCSSQELKSDWQRYQEIKQKSCKTSFNRNRA